MDNLLRKVSSWLDDQRACAAQLRKLAREMDSAHRIALQQKKTGAVLGIVGGFLTVAAGVVTVVSAGAAAPLVPLAAGVGALGAVTTMSAELIESMHGSQSLREAEWLVEKSRNDEEAIRRELQSLYQQGGGRGSTPHSEEDAVACITKALKARQGNNYGNILGLIYNGKTLVSTIYKLFYPGAAAASTALQRLVRGCFGCTVGILMMLSSYKDLEDIMTEVIRMDKGGGSGVGDTLRDAANKIEDAAERLKSDVEDARRKLM